MDANEQDFKALADGFTEWVPSLWGNEPGTINVATGIRHVEFTRIVTQKLETLKHICEDYITIAPVNTNN